ncbi:MAG: 1-acyl-sn-glycerol-3-phosphate acyltransferase [Deltaproteobacteria bacterium]|nr:1-acyl-sn-glycerol-3-phosphate acyltransferase [Deltaproteobacteria bacterium]
MIWVLYSIVGWLLIAIFTIIALIQSRVLIFFYKDQPAEQVFFQIAGTWSKRWGRLMGIDIHVHPDNQKILEAGKSYVLTANHLCFLDFLGFAYGLRIPFRALSKVENRKIPIFGAMIAPAIVTVDRASSQDRMASMQRMRDLITRGMSVLVFPEGTRNKNFAQPLGKKFYDGAFRIAIEAQVPIAPLLILGARKVMPDGTWQFRPGRMDVEVLPTISTLGKTKEDIPALREHVYQIMAQAIYQRDNYFQAED